MSYDIIFCNMEEWNKALNEIGIAEGMRDMSLNNEWLKVHQLQHSKENEPLSIAVYENERPIALMQAVSAKSKLLTSFRFGGIEGRAVYFDNGIDENKQKKIIREVINKIRVKTLFNMFIFYSYNDGKFRETLKRLGFKTSSGSVMQTPILDISVGEEELWKNLKKETRNQVRQGQKRQVIIEEATNDYGIKELCLLKEEKSTYREPIDKDFLREVVSKGFVKIFLAKVGGEVAAGAAIYCSGSTIGYYAGTLDKKFQWNRPMNVLHWEIVKWAVKNGYKTYNLWGADTKESELYPLTAFKLGFGAELVETNPLRKIYLGVFGIDISFLSGIFESVYQGSAFFRKLAQKVIKK